MAKKKGSPAVGSVTWFDLTVNDAARVRTFYSKVVGWSHDEVDMGGYADYAMRPPGSKSPVTGIVHNRTVNKGIPPQWLIYITVADLKKSLAAVKRLGGKIVHGPRDMGPYGTFAVIKDPAGAVAGLIQPPKA